MGKTPLKNQYGKFLHINTVHRALFLQNFLGVITTYGDFVVLCISLSAMTEKLHVETSHVMTNSDTANFVAC